MILNKNDIIEYIKTNPRNSAIGGVVVILLFFLMISLMFGGGEVDKDTPTFETKKGPLRISITEAGTIQPKEKIIVKNEVEGNTSIIYIVDEGTKVKKGDLLVELDSSNLVDLRIDQEIMVQNGDASFVSARENHAVTQNQAKSDVDKAQLAYDFAKQDLDKYIKGEYPNQLKQAESKITLADEEYTRAKDKLEWSTKLYSEKYLSQSELQADQLAEKQKKLSLELAQNELDLLKNYTHKRQLIQLESDVSQAEMALERTTRKAKADIVQSEANLKAKEAEYNQQKDKLKKIETQIEKTKIYAPADGLALYATSTQRGGGRFGRSEEPLDEGSSIRERQELIHLPTTTGFNVEIGIYETSLDKVRPGLRVLITIDAIPGETYFGTLESVAQVPDAMSSFMNPDLKLYPAVISIDNTDNIKLLKSGMGCIAEIIVEQYKEAIYIPVQAVIRVNGKPTVFIVDGNDLEPKPVEIGLDNNRMVRIIKGLEEGDEVSLTPPLIQAVLTEDDNIMIDDPNLEPVPGVEINSPVSIQDNNRNNQQSSRSFQPGGGQQQGPGGNMGNMNMPSKDEIINRMDRNGDGKIAQDEFMGTSEAFATMDKNKDGFVESDEFDFSSMRRNTGNMPRTKEDFIKRSDSDGDGKIAESEFTGPPDFFSNMDQNGDGFITLDEAPDPSSFGRGSSGGFGGPPVGMQGGGFNEPPPGGSR